MLSHATPAHLLEHERLPLLVRSRGISLGDVERDLASAKRVEHDGREAREPKPSFNEPDGEPELPGDPLDVCVLLYELLEGRWDLLESHGTLCDCFQRERHFLGGPETAPDGTSKLGSQVRVLPGAPVVRRFPVTGVR
ncbi:MAG TPA: hypothetical protein VF662_09380 [Allosphingosinicella sp.]|jgi:hypothetical protein